MSVATIHSFLVHPAKHEETPPTIGGARVSKAHGGRLLRMLEDLYVKADVECNIDISFDGAPDGRQANECRDLIVSYVQKRQMADGRALAERLQSVTTHTSGLGLLFLLVGGEGKHTKLVISRFRADSGILAEQKKDELSVQFLERIFMKNATSYKAVVYRDTSVSAGFWDGKAVDRQLNLGATISNYWIKEFLASDFRTTSAAGTRRLADALRNATAKAPNVEVKSELISAVRLARGLNGTSTSISDLLSRFQLSEAASQLVRRQVASHLLGEHFRLDAAELDKHVPLRSVELDNGGLLTAPTPSFDDIFKRETIRQGGGRVRFTAEGRVVDDKLRKDRSRTRG